MSEDDEPGRLNRLLAKLPGAAVETIGLQRIAKLSSRTVDALFEAIRVALEADEAATVEALRAHDDPIDTVTALVKIIRDGGEEG